MVTISRCSSWLSFPSALFRKIHALVVVGRLMVAIVQVLGVICELLREPAVYRLNLVGIWAWELAEGQNRNPNGPSGK